MAAQQKSSRPVMNLFGTGSNPATIFGSSNLWGIQEPLIENFIYAILGVLIFVL